MKAASDASMHDATRRFSVGTAGWNVSGGVAASFPGAGRHLERYAQVMSCVEIDSSFYRRHRLATYARWSSETPAGFRFAVKLPRTITHEARLVDAGTLLTAFLEDVVGLGEKLGVLLVQLPPSLAFATHNVERFLSTLRTLHRGAIVCEPRHLSWFQPAADDMLRRHHVGRVAADPAVNADAAQPGGWLGPENDGRGAVLYHRWHGSPKRYWSNYEEEWLADRAAELRRWHPDADRWCLFDNTAAGAALANALSLMRLLSQPGEGVTPSAISFAAPR